MIFWDTSALVSMLVTEKQTPLRRAQLLGDPDMAVWWGTLVECESGLQRRLREKALNMESVSQARKRLEFMAASWYEVPSSPELRQIAIRLLRTHPLRAADALQLAAALTVAGAGVDRLRFACSDTRLNLAAEIENLVLLEMT